MCSLMLKYETDSGMGSCMLKCETDNNGASCMLKCETDNVNDKASCILSVRLTGVWHLYTTTNHKELMRFWFMI